jgi:hypothetical protein
MAQWPFLTAGINVSSPMTPAFADVACARKRHEWSSVPSAFVVHSGVVDQHQRDPWSRMLGLVATFERREVDLTRLVAALRVEYVEADPHDARIRDEFESKWVRIDGENELRTESWAPKGAANDSHLREALNLFCEWVRSVLAADPTNDHR